MLIQKLHILISTSNYAYKYWYSSDINNKHSQTFDIIVVMKNTLHFKEILTSDNINKNNLMSKVKRDEVI